MVAVSVLLSQIENSSHRIKEIEKCVTASSSRLPETDFEQNGFPHDTTRLIKFPKSLSTDHPVDNSITNDFSLEVNQQSNLSEITTSDREYLARLRSVINDKINKIQTIERGHERCKAVEAMYVKSTEQIKNLLANMFLESEQLIISPPPCKYCVFAVGSLSVNQCNSFSDFEFGILTENDNYLTDSLNYNYFRELFKLVETRILNIDGDAQVHHLKKRDADFKKIQSVENMLNIVQNDTNENELWMDTSRSLESSCFVHGEQALHDEQFRPKVIQFLSMPAHGSENPQLLTRHVRALQRLMDCVTSEEFLGDCFSFDYSIESTADYSAASIMENVHHFHDRFIHNLALLYDLSPTSPWDVVLHLGRLEYLNHTAVDHLMDAVSCAAILKASRSCITHTNQHEDVDKIATEAGASFQLCESDFEPDSDLLMYFYTVLPLLAELRKGMSNSGCGSSVVPLLKSSICLEMVSDCMSRLYGSFLHDSSALVKARVSLMFARNYDAGEWLRVALSDTEIIEDQELRTEQQIVIHKTLGRINTLLGNPVQTLSDYRAIIDILALRYGVILSSPEAFDECPADQDIVWLLTNMGLTHSHMNEFNSALQLHKFAHALCIRSYYDNMKEQCLCSDHVVTAGTLANLAITLQKLHRYNEAISYYQLCIDMYERLNSNGVHDMIVANLTFNLADSEKEIGNLSVALNLYNSCLLKFIVLYDGSFHEEVFRAQDSIGLTLHCLGRYGEASEVFDDSIRKQEIYYLGSKRSFLIATLNNAANAHRGLHSFEAALERYNKSLECQRALYAGADHENTIITLANLGAVCRIQGKFKEALEYCLSSVEMSQRLYSDIGVHQEWMMSLCGLAHVYSAMNDFVQSIKHFGLGIDMCAKLSNDSDCNEMADCLDNIGIVHGKNSQFGLSVQYLEKSLAMRLRILQHSQATNEINYHPSLSCTYLNLGNAYTSAKMYDLSFTMHQLSLQVRYRQVGEDVDHADIARSWNNIGVNFRMQGHLDLALDNLTKGLEMRRRVHIVKPASDVLHNETASSLFNLALVYQDLSQFKKAVEILQECLHIQLAVSPQPFPRIGVTLDHLGNLFTNHLDDELSALRCYSDCLKYRKLAYPCGVHVEIVKTLEDMARIQKQALQDYHSSVTSYNQACDVIRALSAYPQQSFDLAKNMTEAAECYVRLNDLTTAARLCGDVMSLCNTQNGPAFRQLSALASEWSGGIHRALGFTALDNHDYAVGIHHFELSLKHTPQSQVVGLHQALTHQMGNMHHILITQLRVQLPQDSARIAHHTKKGEECFRKACDLKTRGNIAGGVGTFTECANFLIEINKHTEALPFLLQAIAHEPNDNESCGMLGYDVHEYLCITPALREYLDKEIACGRSNISINAKELAYYLLILLQNFTVFNDSINFNDISSVLGNSDKFDFHPRTFLIESILTRFAFCRVVALIGIFGSSGKTTSSLQLCRQLRRINITNHVIWTFDCSSIESLHSNFVQLALKLNIFVTSFSFELISMICSAIQTKSTECVLFYFDNANNYLSIVAYLPPHQFNINVLISSRSRSFINISTVSCFDEPSLRFSEREAEVFLPCNASFNRSHLREIVIKNNFHPLHLCMAKYYMMKYDKNPSQFLALNVTEFLARGGADDSCLSAMNKYCEEACLSAINLSDQNQLFLIQASVLSTTQPVPLGLLSNITTNSSEKSTGIVLFINEMQESSMVDISGVPDRRYVNVHPIIRQYVLANLCIDGHPTTDYSSVIDVMVDKLLYYFHKDTRFHGADCELELMKCHTAHDIFHSYNLTYFLLAHVEQFLVNIDSVKFSTITSLKIAQLRHIVGYFYTQCDDKNCLTTTSEACLLRVKNDFESNLLLDENSIILNSVFVVCDDFSFLQHQCLLLFKALRVADNAAHKINLLEWYISNLYSLGRTWFYDKELYKDRMLEFKQYLLVASILSKMLPQFIEFNGAQYHIIHEYLCDMNGLLQFDFEGEINVERLRSETIPRYLQIACACDNGIIYFEEQRRMRAQNDQNDIYKKMKCHQQILHAYNIINNPEQDSFNADLLVTQLDVIADKLLSFGNETERIANIHNMKGQHYFIRYKTTNNIEHLRLAKRSFIQAYYTELAKNNPRGKCDHPLFDACIGLARIELRKYEFGSQQPLTTQAANFKLPHRVIQANEYFNKAKEIAKIKYPKGHKELTKLWAELEVHLSHEVL